MNKKKSWNYTRKELIKMCRDRDSKLVDASAKSSAQHRRFQYLVIESSAEIDKLKTGLKNKEELNDKLMYAVDKYRTESVEKGLYIDHLESLLRVFIPVEKSVDNHQSRV